MTIDLYTKLFNMILNKGIVPESWSSGIIIPLYKKKGEKSNIDNYRGITMMSCLDKLFTSVINARLSSERGSQQLTICLHSNVYCIYILAKERNCFVLS